MSTWTIAVAALAAVGMAAAVAVMLRRTAPASLLSALGLAALAVSVSAALAVIMPGMPPAVAVVVATGTAPVAVLLLGLLEREDGARAPAVVAVAIWAAVVVPASIVVPQVLAASCPPESCVVEDFAGGLPFAVGVGAFVLVPSAAVPTLRRAHESGRIGRSAALVLLVWAAFVVWLAALELDVDPYTPRIALVALLAPAVAAIGWVVTDRIRGLDASATRGLTLGTVAGMVGILPSVVSVDTPWAILVGALVGITGALAHDARALRASPPTARVAVAAVVVGVGGMIVPGVLGNDLGFVFAARVDVLGTQLLAAGGVAIVAILVSIPAAVVLRRGAEV